MKEVDSGSLEKTLGVSFKNKILLKESLTHRSYLNENPRLKLEHNERLEFLGDAVLELAVTIYLYKKYPNKTEGDLTAYRAALVNTITISDAAKNLGINDYLLLSKGEAKDTGKARQYILANSFEAVIGAIYLDQGYEVAEQFIGRNLFYRIDAVINERLWQDAKSFFQEKAQEVEGITPSYQILREEGPDHKKIFTVGVYLGKELIAEGEGRSKQEAEQEAAAQGLAKKKWKAS